MSRRIFFWAWYLMGRVPWDTGITPPEIVTLIEHEQIPPGHAIDLGCGTGTNVIYLARHGWQAVGVDYIARPINAARRKARRAGVGDRTRFLVGDITRLSSIDLGGPFDLAMDIGCGHSLPAGAQAAYADDLARIVRPGGVFMLYMFRPTPGRPGGLDPGAVEALFAPAFRLVWTDLGEDTAIHSASAWYRLERVGPA